MTYGDWNLVLNQTAGISQDCHKYTTFHGSHDKSQRNTRDY